MDTTEVHHSLSMKSLVYRQEEKQQLKEASMSLQGNGIPDHQGK